MNNMTTEEKAKAYDEAIKKAESLYKASEPMSGCNVIVETLFPELKESEDERIRKRLINYFHGFLDGYEDTYKVGGCIKWEGLDIKDVIAWLEKQGEQKPVTDFSDIRTWKYIVDAVWTEKEGIGQYLDSPFTEEVAKKLQKRFGNIEQKPADKIEPKFKVGQTIKKEGFNLGFTIVKIEDSFYYNDIGDYFPFTDQDNWELVESAWSEEDEKIIKRIDSLLYSQCKIHGSEYEEIHNWFKSLKDRYLPQPKQEWSEEDDIMVHDIDYALRCQIAYPKPRLNSMSSWIYKLKNRIQPKQEWSKEDTAHYNRILKELTLQKEMPINISVIKEVKSDIIWFKSLKDRIQLKPQWKPSDEQMEELEWSLHHWIGKTKEILESLYEQLKKLREE